jgi:transposase
LRHISTIKFLSGGDMGYKQIDQNMTFAEVSLLKSMEHNRSLKRLEKINQVINWSQVEEILMAHYTVGSSREGADAYPPLMLLKGLLLEKWYRIDSDPELENQINDRISFKKFMGLSFDQHSPDHSTFSRFRGRLSKEAMTRINSVVLQQFSRKGLTINEGIAVDATPAISPGDRDDSPAKATNDGLERQFYSPASRITLHQCPLRAATIDHLAALPKQSTFVILPSGRRHRGRRLHRS